MLPRFIIKTHTEALRPGNYSILITKCTFPNKGAYPESVEKRLSEFLGKSVAKYTILTATKKNRGFGFLLDNMIWSWKGHVINAVIQYLNKHSDDTSVYFSLERIERIAYLRYFLETEGALILKLAERFAIEGKLTYSYLKSDIRNIFREIYEDYHDMAPDFRSRIRIKEMFKETQRRLKRKEQGYDPGTLAHKIKPHIQALSDLHLLSIDKKDGEEIYKPYLYKGVSPFDVLIETLCNLKQMEELFSTSTDGYYSIIAQALNLNPNRYFAEIHEEILKQTFLYGYKIMKDKVTGMADIDALIDWSCIKLLSEENVLATRKDIEEFLHKMRQINPSSVRYHVDGKGRIAYLILELENDIKS